MATFFKVTGSRKGFTTANSVENKRSVFKMHTLARRSAYAANEFRGVGSETSPSYAKQRQARPGVPMLNTAASSLSMFKSKFFRVTFEWGAEAGRQQKKSCHRHPPPPPALTRATHTKQKKKKQNQCIQYARVRGRTALQFARCPSPPSNECPVPS